MADANTTQPNGEQTAEYHGSRIVSVRLDEDLISALNRRSEQQGKNRSKIIRLLISDGLNEGSA